MEIHGEMCLKRLIRQMMDEVACIFETVWRSCVPCIVNIVSSQKKPLTNKLIPATIFIG